MECPEHVWRLLSAELRADGAWSEYECERCGETLAVGPGEEHPPTA